LFICVLISDIFVFGRCGFFNASLLDRKGCQNFPRDLPFSDTILDTLRIRSTSSVYFVTSCFIWDVEILPGFHNFSVLRPLLKPTAVKNIGFELADISVK
jgi:hypothetical protein